MHMRHLAMAALSLASVASPAQPSRSPDFELPKGMSCRWSQYTAAAARAEAQGTVHFTVTIGEESRVTGVDITQSSGASREHKQLDRVTRESLLACRWVGPDPVAPGSYAGSFTFRLDPVSPEDLPPRLRNPR